MAERGKRKESLRYHIQSLNIRQQKGNNDDMLNSLHSIAFLHESAKDYDKAIKYAEKAIMFSIGNETIASSHHYLAQLYEANEQNEKAIPAYEKSLEAIRNHVGREHSAYFNVAFRRANLLAKVQKTREAIEAHAEVCEIFQNVSVSNHIFYANSLRNMAILHKQLGEKELAEACAIKSMKMRACTTDDILEDVIFLIKLYLSDETPDIKKSIETIIYFMMNTDIDEDNLIYYMKIICICEALVDDNCITLEECINAIESLLIDDNIISVMQKWTVLE
jgi:tetratricopeptide (TPR) repeat protein